MARNFIDSLILSYKSPTVDNFVFRLCYRWTVWILIGFSVVVTCKLTWGISFSCMTSYDALPQTFLDAKCYYEPLFTSADQRLREEMAYASQRPMSKEEIRIYHSFYPWVNLTLIIQALIFYVPHLLWKTYESGFIGRLTAGLQISLGKEQKRSQEMYSLAKYVLQTQGKHKLFTLMYLFFEVCNFGIAIVQTMWLVNFFNSTGIPDYLNVDLSMWSEYRDFYFPSSGKCRVTKFSTSSERITERITLEAQCALPLNHLYMKMYLFLRAWYILLILATSVVMIYRLALLTQRLRVVVIQNLAPFQQRSNAKALCHQMSYGDWFFLTALRKTMPELEFSKLLDKILIISQNKVKEPNSLKDDEDRLSVYEDSHKDLESSVATTPL